MTHAELVRRAEKWLKGAGKCKFSFSELASYSNFEIPDAIGFSFWNSILIECKTTRSDFRADLKKSFRRTPENGCGFQRYFLCEKGLIDKDELPEGWGLLYLSSRGCRKIKPSKFEWTAEQAHKIRWNERYLLVSALNRFGIRLNGDFSTIYNIDWKPAPMWLHKHNFKTSYLGPI